MSSDINAVFIIGRMTKDPELKFTPGGTAVCSFSIANNKTYVKDGGKIESVSYFQCIAWTKTGEVIAEYCKKGHRIGIEGRLQQRSWKDKDGNNRQAVEINVEKFQFLESKKDGAKDTTPAEEIKQTKIDFPDESNPFNEEEIPF